MKPSLKQATNSRESSATSDLGALFAPRSVAVIGASAEPARFTGRIIPTLQRHGYRGAIYPVNPKRSELNGLPCYQSLADVPADIDCVVYGIGAGHILPVVDACAAKGVRLLVVASAGFAENGTAEGKALQQELVHRARAHGIRVLGPNGIGFGNFVDRAIISAAAVMAWPDVPRGGIGLVSQSGGLGLATIAYCAFEEGIHFSHLISTGNEADIDTIEVAEFFVDDDATDVIAITLEAVRQPDRFIRLLRRAGAAGKPVVVLKSGRSDLGKVMAASHTGAMAGQSAVFEMVCREYGVTMAEDVDDFYQIAAMFGKLRASGKLAAFTAPGEGCAALSLSGGHVGLFADHGSLAGLRFPALRGETTRSLADCLGFDGHFQNPLDTTARVIGNNAFWGKCVRALMDQDDIQVVVPIITVAPSYAEALEDFVRIAGERREILLVVWAGGSFGEGEKEIVRRSDVPVFRTPARAAEALRALQRYCARWNRPDATPETLPVLDNDAARSLLAQARAEGRTTLLEHESKRILAAIGMPTPRDAVVSSISEAEAAAEALGYPVAVKGEHPEFPHKSDVGLVALGIADATMLRATVADMHARLPEDGRGQILIQEMRPPTQELILGVNTDPEFGPVVMVGLGGVFVEVMQDFAMRLPPFGVTEAKRMLGELRGISLLQGARGTQPVDLDSLADLVARFSVFADHNRDMIAEIDINPLAVVAGDAGCPFALDALIVLQDD